MNIETFIKRHRAEITAYIKAKSRCKRLNDRERRLWILNDEPLYLWAKREGVPV